jgi:hypothetical protein
MPLASFVKRNLGRFSHIYAKKHLIVEISVQVVGRSQGSYSHHPVYILTFCDIWLPDTELIGGQCASLVGAEYIYTCQGLDSSQLLYNSFLLRKVSSTDS